MSGRDEREGGALSDVVQTLAPIVAGAVVAGLSALLKGAFERRDARVTAERQLSLAARRTAFIKEWLAVSNDVNDPAYAQDAAVRAKADLERAYTEANEALARGQSVIEESWHDKVVDQLRWLLLIRDRHTAAARIVVLALYVVVTLVWVGGLAPEDAGDPDAVPVWQDALWALLFTIILRAVAGVIVRALDSRRTRQARHLSAGPSIQGTSDMSIAAPPPAHGG